MKKIKYYNKKAPEILVQSQSVCKPLLHVLLVLNVFSGVWGRQPTCASTNRLKSFGFTSNFVFGVKSKWSSKKISILYSQAREQSQIQKAGREIAELIGTRFCWQNHPNICFRLQIYVVIQDIIHPPWAFWGFLPLLLWILPGKGQNRSQADWV